MKNTIRTAIAALALVGVAPALSAQPNPKVGGAAMYPVRRQHQWHRFEVVI